MADFSSLKQTIQSYIKQNGNEEITGNILQDVLLAMVTTMGDSAINSLALALQDEITARQNQDGTLQENITAESTARQQADTALGGRIDGLQTAINGINTKLEEGYIYAGIATPSTNPGTPSGKVFYIAVQAGTYTNFGGAVVTYGINILKYNSSAWSKDAIFKIDDIPTAGSDNPVKSGGVFECINNPILKNHTYEIRYRGTSQLVWNDEEKKLYWTSGTTIDPNGSMIYLYFGTKIIRIGIGEYSERYFDTAANAQLLLPIPTEAVSDVYTLNDIVVLPGTTYDESAYVKIAHITFGNGISSFICKKEVKDAKILLMERKVADIEMLLNPDFNYAQNVMDNKNITADGTIQDYNNRYVVFYRLPQKGNAPFIISDIDARVYAWYSGIPDYTTGSNSLGRTNTNTPPQDAEYGGLVFVIGKPTSINISSKDKGNELLRSELSTLGSAINNSFGENSFANGMRSNLKILGYGNSFMRNSVAYLSAIAHGCGVNLTVGNLYTGGTELQDHFLALQNDSPNYAWFKYENGVETQAESHQAPMRGLLEERWDAIIVHQYIPWEYPFEPTLSKFLKLIIERLGYTPKIYINATWAGSLDENQTYYGYETEEEMWEAMLDYVKGACADSGVQEFSIIPTGTAIQDARTLSWADSYNRFVNNSPDLHHLNPAGGFIAACTLYQKIVAPLNGIACSQTTFRITSETAMPPSTEVQQGILVTDNNYSALCKCAIDAVSNPYTITQQ